MKQALLLLLLFSNSIFGQVNLNQGLVAYYPFSGNANDASGNNNNPVFNNATLTADRSGNANSAYSFNGTNDYIQIPNSPSLNPSNQISICAWVKIAGFYQGPCHGNNVVMKGDADYLPGNYVIRFDDSYFSGNQNCFISSPDIAHETFFGVQSSQLPNSPFIQTNQWYSVVFTCDGVTANTYVNCQLVGSGPANGITFTNGYDLFLGRLNDPQFPYWFNGTMDEVRIYNRALNGDEIKAYGDCTANNTVTASFTAPDTVCVNTPIQITNTSISATNYYWNFCVANTTVPPIGTNIGNVGGQMQMPVYIDYVYDNGNYYGFVTNNAPAGLLRLDFGSSLLNNPTVTNLGNVGGVIPANAEGLQIVNDAGNWDVIIVGGDPFGAVISKIVKVELGSNIANNSPIATDWGNIGNLSYPHDLYIFNDNGNWYGFTVNYDNSTITKFNFTNSFSNTPTAINLGNIGSLNGPTGLHAINDNGNWSLFVTNALSSTLTRIDFGNSLLNTPTAQNLGNPGGLFHTCWDIFVLKFCGENTAFVINANQSYNDLVRLNFGGSITNVPTAQSFGNIGNCLFPHCLSKIFRVGSDLYSFITNVDNNTLTRLQFTGCTNSNIPNSTLQNPPPVTYNLPGVYNINLSVDDGLPTQTTYCKQVVVQPCTDTIINNYTSVLAFNPCDNKIIVEDASAFNIGDTVLVIQMKGAIIDSSNSSAFGTVTNYKNAGNYEFNYIKSKSGNIIELKNVVTKQYDVTNGKVQLVRVPYYQDVTFTFNLTCLPWDGSKGGIVALNVQNTLTLNANIDVSGKGFKGGIGYNSQNNTLDCFENNYNYPLSSNANAGMKGESIVSISNNIICGKGSPAGGGGGGLGHNSGGGGGANGGGGGFGGYQLDACGNYPFDNRGIGGHAASNSTTPNKIFLGSGGGAGHSDNLGNLPNSGGNGGGIIIINSDKIKTNNYKISANGSDGVPCSMPPSTDCHDGMGGGGGGGSILLNVNQLLDNSITENKGGKGADMIGSVALGHRIGAGGGGGGGMLFIKSNSLPANLANVNNGGANGVLTTDNDNPYGATPGQNGVVLYNLQIPIDSVLFKINIDSVRIKDSLVGCNSLNFQNIWFTNTSPITSWQWDFGDGNTGNTQNLNHTYTASSSATYTVKVIAADINGCKDSSSISITTANLPIVKTNNDTAFCPGAQVQLNTTGAASYAWLPSNGLSNSNIANPLATPAATTQYIVVGRRSDGCTGKDTVNITIYPNPVISKSSDTIICKNSFAQLFAGGGISYSWSPSIYLSNNLIANPVATPVLNTVYHVTVTDVNTCTNTDSIKVTIRPDPAFAINNPSNICLNNSVQLNASGGNSYSWQPSAYLNNSSISNPTASPKNTTSYSVVITDTVCNNTTTLSTTVTVFSLPVITADKSNDIDCSHDFSQLNVTGAAKYEWSPAATLNNSTVANPVAHPTAPTLYIVKGSDVNGCVSYDSVMVNITDYNKSGYFMPNAFTPNNDGLNDCYGIKFWGIIQELDFGIYNRWGERIFHTSNPGDCWDGTYKGVQQDPGVYVYLITAKTFCGKVFKKGTFALIR